MGDMFPESGKNNIYISDSSYGYTEIDMINLFGSPAGRAINKITSIKLNKSGTSAPKSKSKSKDNININSNPNTNSNSTNSTTSYSNSSSSCCNAINSNDYNTNNRIQGNSTTSNDKTKLTTFLSTTVDHDDQQNRIKAISGSIGVETNIVGINSNCYGSSSCIAATTNTKSSSNKYVNLHKKKSKCWEFLENNNGGNKINNLSRNQQNNNNNNSNNNKSNNNWNSAGNTTSNDELKVESFDELITDAEIYQEAVRFLGLSCSLTNSCRCLECQSRYFDDFDDEYPDSDDDDYDEDDYA